MTALWNGSEAMSAADVRQCVGQGLAYTSVATVLTRLHEKGLVMREYRGRSFVYWPALSESEWLSGRMSAVLDGARDRRALLAGFVGTLSKRDVRDLRRLLGPPDSDE